ncbi:MULTISPECIES: PQQ-binding-like beta-propeller repeat protein [unclassified Roseateles]|uniref:outer membrane protein assembly factor BamB family protein n=1 Tax=unclassified Roseateles TaxID=2626991 RepID=UPI000AE47276|nr:MULTISPECIES: PQQ-binding-like beta-propeller repeat protein [unclassified Roseateles]
MVIETTGRRRRRLTMCGLALAGLMGSGPAAKADPNDAGWPSAGQNLSNTRHQAHSGGISVQTVGGLTQKWVFTTGGDVSATPAVDMGAVYFPDWAGNLYAVDRQTGAQLWKVSVGAASGTPGDKARATPVIAGNKLIVGTQGNVFAPPPFGGPGGKLLAFDKQTGGLLWATQLDNHYGTIITQSATAHGDRVYVGVASLEEALAGSVGFCCSFRGSMLALDINTGAIVWKTYMVPPGYSGGAIWGSAPAVDVKRGQVYIATGNNYSVPEPVRLCVIAAGTDTEAVKACLAVDNYFDAVVALDMRTGAVRWATKALPADIWTAACIGFGDPAFCPNPTGPDYDFGQAPALFTVKVDGKGKPQDVVGAGQKSGKYWAMDPDTGAVKWVTQAGPGGTGGGLQWGSAVDGKRVYTANANSDAVPWPAAGGLTSGVWSGIDAVTGQLLWQTRPSGGGSTSGPVTTTNGVVFGCSLDRVNGYMYALDGATGVELWKFSSGGSCLSGAAISKGQVFWGSGYSNLFGAFGGPNNKLYAFEIR